MMEEMDGENLVYFIITLVVMFVSIPACGYIVGLAFRMFKWGAGW